MKSIILIILLTACTPDPAQFGECTPSVDLSGDTICVDGVLEPNEMEPERTVNKLRRDLCAASWECEYESNEACYIDMLRIWEENPEYFFCLVGSAPGADACVSKYYFCEGD